MQNLNKLSWLTIIGSGIGACLEWFDFSVFIYVTPMISKNFFPHQSTAAAMLGSFGVLAVGYLVRPLGGIYFGHLGDRIGRKKVLKIVTVLIAVPTILTAFLPNYATWGLAATIILLLLRVLQGFSVGGEYTSVLVMLIEQAPARHKALVTSVGTVVAGLGVLLSSLLIALLINTLGIQAMYHWGWRIPFVIAFLLAIVSYIFQCLNQESPYFESIKQQKSETHFPLLTAIKRSYKLIIAVLILTGFFAMAFYVVAAFLSTYMISMLHFSKSDVMYITTLATLSFTVTAPIFGYLSDKWGRKPMLMTAIILLGVFIYPIFLAISTGNLLYICLLECLLMAFVALGTVSLVTTASELFMTNERLSAVSTAYNVGNAIFGGTTPLVATFLIHKFNSQFAVSYYVILFAVVSFLVVKALLPETATSEMK